MSSKNIIFYLWNNKDNSDKIYGALEAGGHIFAFYGRRNPSEDPKDKASLTVIEVGKGADNFDEELTAAFKLCEEKIHKGYNPLFISDKLAIVYTTWKLNYLKSIYTSCKIGGDSVLCVDNNYHNFDEIIKKKLAKKMMLRK